MCNSVAGARQVSERGGQSVARKFAWRDRKGVMHDPAKMQTSHLFYTLRMIWNHSMPEEAAIHPYRAYSFGRQYTQDYMKNAIVALGRELGTRSDIHPKHAADIEHMMRHLSTMQIESK